jgi:hypothetical protein
MTLRDRMQHVQQDDGIETAAQRQRDAGVEQIQPAENAGGVRLEGVQCAQRSATSLKRP